MDFAKHQNLHTIIMLRDVIRKWWHTELCFADKNGAVLEWASGDKIVPPPNDFCRLSLFSKEGFRRCTQSVRVLHEKFRSSKKLRSALFHSCHLNFIIAGAPIYIDNEYQGFLFMEGFATQAPTPREGESLKEKIKELNAGGTDLARAVERIPVLGPDAVDRLTDLLEFGATEIANYESDRAKRDDTIQTISPEALERYKFDNVVGSVPQMQPVFHLLRKVQNTDSTVLLEGESGTGKGFLAKVIHFNSPRRDKPFASQTLSGLDETLIESTLFGHVRGAFPGALRDKKGLFELCEGGTLLLDEVADLTPNLQLKLLRALQDGVYLPLGSTQTKETNLRVLASTRYDLSGRVKEGRFREDLFYLIHILHIRLPSLRERKEDLPLMVEQLFRRVGRQTRALSPEAQQMFEAYDWPGNVLELRNELERLCVLAADGEPIPGDLVSPRIRAAVGMGGAVGRVNTSAKLNEAVELLEKEMIAGGLARTGNNKSRLARELGISRSNLILKIAKYGLARLTEAEAAEAAGA